MLYLLRRLVRKIKRVMSSIPLMWNSEDWDYWYLLELIAWKLKRMEASMVSFEGCERTQKEIKTVRLTIERLMHHNYMDKEYREALSNWWDTKKEYQEGNLTVMKFSDEFEKELEEGRQRAERLEQQDWNFVFNTMKRKIRT